MPRACSPRTSQELPTGAYIGEADAIDVVHEHLGSHNEFALGLQRIHQQVALHVLLKEGLQSACVPVLMS